MAAIRPAPICINGNWWRDVTNETTDGPIYQLRDVIACGGQVPWIVSSGPSKPVEIKKNRHERRKEKVLRG